MCVRFSLDFEECVVVKPVCQHCYLIIWIRRAGQYGRAHESAAAS